jgi:hypothetical protein
MREWRDLYRFGIYVHVETVFKIPESKWEDKEIMNEATS